MPSFWVTFVGRTPSGTIEADSAEDARSIAESKYSEAVRDVDYIPYSSSPILHSDGKPSTGFEPRCAAPSRCKGKMFCQKRPSCTE
jgi:hypothetical protein